jgi:transcriptional regulator with XRE-family HTH domain
VDALITLFERTPGMNQTDLAERMGVGRAQVSNIFRDRSATKLPRAAAWADALGHRLVLRLVPKKSEPQIEAITDLAVALSSKDLEYLYRLARVLSLFTDIEKLQVNGTLEGMEGVLRATGRLGQKASST